MEVLLSLCLSVLISCFWEADGTRWLSRFRGSSDHCEIEVVDVLVEPRTRYLRCGHALIGAAFLDPLFEGQSPFAAFALMQGAIEFLVEPVSRPARVLALGLGAGTVPSLLRALPWDVSVDVVEMSRQIVTAAVAFFGYQRGAGPWGRTRLRNATALLLETEPLARYDVVLHDIYDGTNRGADRTVLERIRDVWLRSDGRGVLMLNMVGWQRPPSGGHSEPSHPYGMTLAVAELVADVFGSVRALPDQSQEAGSVGNVLLIASSGQGAASITWRVPSDGYFAEPSPGSHDWVIKHFQEWEVHDLFVSSSMPRRSRADAADRHEAARRLQGAMWEVVHPLLPDDAWPARSHDAPAAVGEEL